MYNKKTVMHNMLEYVTQLKHKRNEIYILKMYENNKIC